MGMNKPKPTTLPAGETNRKVRTYAREMKITPEEALERCARYGVRTLRGVRRRRQEASAARAKSNRKRARK